MKENILDIVIVVLSFALVIMYSFTVKDKPISSYICGVMWALNGMLRLGIIFLNKL